MFDRIRDASVVARYYLYRAVAGPGFIWPVYVLYLLRHDLTFTAIGAIGAIQTAVVLSGEIPTGYVGDQIGRRDSLAIAQIVFGASAVGMIVATDFVGFAASFAVLSFATTWVSGSDDAWLYDVLAERLDEDDYTHVRGRGAAVGQWVTAATMVAGGLLYVVEPVAPFVALLGARALTLLVVLTLPRTERYARDDDAGARDRSPGDTDERSDASDRSVADGETDADERSVADSDTAVDSGTDTDSGTDADGDDTLSTLEAPALIRDHLLQPPLRPFVAYVGLFFGIAMTAGVYIQPIAVDALEGGLGSLLGDALPETAMLGLLYASFTAASAIASDRASDLEAWLGVRRSLLVVPVVVAVLLVVPVAAPVLAFPMFFGLRAGQSLVRPIVGQYLNDHLASVGRATVLSAVAMVYSVVRVPFTLGSGVVADYTSPLVAVAAMGVCFLVVGGVLFALRSPVRTDAGSDSPDADSPGPAAE